MDTIEGEVTFEYIPAADDAINAFLHTRPGLLILSHYSFPKVTLLDVFDYSIDICCLLVRPQSALHSWNKKRTVFSIVAKRAEKDNRPYFYP